MGALLARARAAACLLGLTSLRSILGDSAILLSEPNDFDEVCRAAVGRHLRTLHSCLPALVAGWSCFARAHFARQVFESDLCWLVLFTSLHELDVEEEAKRRFLLLPHYNKTFVTFATTTVEEQPEIALEFGVNATNLPRVCARRAQPPQPPAGHTLLSVLCLFLLLRSIVPQARPQRDGRGSRRLVCHGRQHRRAGESAVAADQRTARAHSAVEDGREQLESARRENCGEHRDRADQIANGLAETGRRHAWECGQGTAGRGRKSKQYVRNEDPLDRDVARGVVRRPRNQRERAVPGVPQAAEV